MLVRRYESIPKLHFGRALSHALISQYPLYTILAEACSKWLRADSRRADIMKARRHRSNFSNIVICVLLAGPVHADIDNPVDFARQILPILSDKCFVCHGPDTKNENQLRLDSYKSATVDRGGYRAIDPEHVEQSELLVRIHSEDNPMPPLDAEKSLSAEERKLLDQWIHQGGKFTQHWAFVPPVKHHLATGKAISPSQAVDTFIEAGLQQKGISIAPEADPPTLARRVALVLTGLPPEPDLLANFLADKSSRAYERLVDQLLNSTHYGEHQARYWLDAVRYGDTHGLHLDNRRGIYPYRDWVVHALNDNLALDKFITWQLAGDLLPDPTLEQLVATGFVRMNPSTAEGGAIPAEFQAKNNFDRTETLGTVLLGMSLTCARCHTHKYDPVPQTEYYRLLAFFNSTAENAMDGNSYTYGPIIKAPENLMAWQTWSNLELTRTHILSKAADQLRAAEKRTALIHHAKLQAKRTVSNWSITKPVASSHNSPPDEAWQPAKDLPGKSQAKMPKSGQSVWLSFDVQTPADQTLWLTHSGNADSQILLDEVVTATPHATSGNGSTPIPLPLTNGLHHVKLKLVGSDEQPPLAVVFLNPWQSLATPDDWKTCDNRDRLLIIADPFGPFANMDFQRQAMDVAIEMSIAKSRFTTTLIAQDLPTRRETKLLKRGEYNLPIGDPLEPGILTVMGDFPTGAPRNRLGLARWLTSRDHPLVARVLVNRIWQRTFGHGLVRTPEDFGLQGQQPTHPKLLDWLAVMLHDSGWNLKHMLRILVNTRTFRQDSAWRSDVDDPENRFFARGPVYRLDAEVLRDLTLWSSGLLAREKGGEGVKPYQPIGMWSALAHPNSNTNQYVRDTGPLLYRRSLYVYWKRTSPHPMMTLFDAPNRESSCVRRSRTNTALQSLALLNETQRIEMSRALAERLLRERNDDNERFDLLFNLLACRHPNAKERTACEKLLQAMRHRYSEAQDDAVLLLSIGEAPRDATLRPSEHAAWSQVAATVLASDVAILLY